MLMLRGDSTAVERSRPEGCLLLEEPASESLWCLNFGAAGTKDLTLRSNWLAIIGCSPGR